MKRNLILLSLAVLTIITLAACSEGSNPVDEVFDYQDNLRGVLEDAEDVSLKVENKSSDYMTEIGGVKVGKDGAVRDKVNLEVPVVVDFFFDPVCLSCSKYNDEVGKVMKDKIEKGEIGVTFHPVPYLNDKSPDDYSNRASAYILSVAEYAPNKILNFIQIVMSEKFRPVNPADNSTPDKKFIQAMEDAGLSGEEIEKVESNKDSYVSVAIAAGKEFSSKDSKWLEFSSVEADNGDKVIFTPFLLINKAGSYESESLLLEGNLIKEFEEKVKSSLK